MFMGHASGELVASHRFFLQAVSAFFCVWHSRFVYSDTRHFNSRPCIISPLTASHRILPIHIYLILPPVELSSRTHHIISDIARAADALVLDSHRNATRSAGISLALGCVYSPPICLFISIQPPSNTSYASHLIPSDLSSNPVTCSQQFRPTFSVTYTGLSSRCFRSYVSVSISHIIPTGVGNHPHPHFHLYSFEYVPREMSKEDVSKASSVFSFESFVPTEWVLVLLRYSLRRIYNCNRDV